MRVLFKETAIEQLARLPRAAQRRILDKIDFFAAQSDPLSFATHLQGYGAYRFRVGNYRVIADVENNTLTILLVAKREGVYRNL